jgi:hypothetical protein
MNGKVGNRDRLLAMQDLLSALLHEATVHCASYPDSLDGPDPTEPFNRLEWVETHLSSALLQLRAMMVECGLRLPGKAAP